jgi:putative two-component system response regulator
MQTLPEEQNSTDPGADGLEELLLQLASARSLDEILAAVRAGARELVGADGITFVLRDGEWCHYAEEDAISPLWKGQRFALRTCIAGWTMLHRTPAVIEDVYADERIMHLPYRPTFVKSLAMMPVRRSDPVAAIGAYWATRHSATEGQIRILQRIANAASVAMANAALNRELMEARKEAEQAQDAIIFAVGSLAEMRDNETANHVLRTQRYVRLLAEAARKRGTYRDQLDDHTIALIYKSAPLHDIGKVGIPDRILLKPGRLNDGEVAIMRTHVQIGHSAIASAARNLGNYTPFFEVAQEIALSHHERWDGSGYPQGLKGEEIPLAGRLMAIADVYDALVSERAYKSAMTHQEALDIIASERGRQFDPLLVDVFLEVAPHFEAVHRRYSDQVIRPAAE